MVCEGSITRIVYPLTERAVRGLGTFLIEYFSIIN